MAQSHTMLKNDVKSFLKKKAKNQKYYFSAEISRHWNFVYVLQSEKPTSRAYVKAYSAISPKCNTTVLYKSFGNILAKCVINKPCHVYLNDPQRFQDYSEDWKQWISCDGKKKPISKKVPRKICPIEKLEEMIAQSPETKEWYWYRESLPGTSQQFTALSTQRPRIREFYDRYVKIIRTTNPLQKLVFFNQIKINFDICVSNFEGFNYKDNCVINAEAVLYIEIANFAKDHENIRRQVSSQGTWKVYQPESLPKFEKIRKQELIDIYPNYETWMYDYEYGMNSDSESDEDTKYEEVIVNTYKKLKDGAIEHSFQTVKRKL